MQDAKKGKKIKDILSYLQEDVPELEEVAPTPPDEDPESILSPEQLERLKKKRPQRAI